MTYSKQEEQLEDINGYSDDSVSETDSVEEEESETDSVEEEESGRFIELRNKIKKLGDELNLAYVEEYSIKIKKNTVNSDRIAYFLTNTNMKLNDDDIDKKQKKINNIINDNLDYLKNELKIKKMPHIEDNKPISEFVYAKDNNKSKVYLGYYQDELIVMKSFEFDNDDIISRTYYEKEVKEDIFKKYKLLKNYQTFFNYKNFTTYYIRKKNKNIDQVSLFYTNFIQIKDFIMLFTKICDKLKWKKEELLKILHKNKHKYVNVITFGDDYISIYYYEDYSI